MEVLRTVNRILIKWKVGSVLKWQCRELSTAF